jgi:hypothetical protein
LDEKARIKTVFPDVAFLALRKIGKVVSQAGFSQLLESLVFPDLTYFSFQKIAHDVLALPIVTAGHHVTIPQDCKV